MNNKLNKNTGAVKPIELFKITGDWNAQARVLKGKYPQLTDADLKFETGHEHELLSRIEKRIRKGRVEVVNIIRKGQPEKSDRETK